MKRVTAKVGDREAVLAKTCVFAQCTWTGPLSLAGLPKGAKELSVLAEDTAGRTREARQSFVYDEPPLLKISGPPSGYVSRDGVFRVTAEAADDTAEPAVSIKVTEYQSGYVLGSYTGGAQVSQEFDARAFDGHKLEVHVSASDGKGNEVKETRTVHVETSSYLSAVEQVPGEIADFDESRILYTAVDGSLRIRGRGTAEDTVVFAQPGRSTLEQKLVPGGAVFSLYRSGSFSDQELYLWQAGQLKPLASGASVRSGTWRAVSGKHAVYDEFPSSQTYYLNTATGERKVIGSFIYHTDITPQGQLVFSDLDGGIYRYEPDTGERTLLLGKEEEPYDYMNPVADGSRLLFSVHTNIAKFDGQSVTELSPPYPEEEIERGANVFPYRDYQANAGWLAYTKTDGENRPIYLESPDGSVSRVADTGGYPSIGRLTENGTLSFYSQGRMYLAKPQGEPTAVASSRGQDFYRGGIFYKTLGDTLFRIDLESDRHPPVWPPGTKLTVSDVTYRSVRLQWTPAEDDQGAVAYQIYRDGTPVALAGDGQTSYTAEDLEPDHTYVFSVGARDGSGNLSSADPQTRVTTAQRPYSSAPPKVEILDPPYEAVVRDGRLHLLAKVSDDGAEPAVSVKLHSAGPEPVNIPASGAAGIDRTLDLSAYEGQWVEVEVTAVDDEGQSASVRRPVHVESGRALLPVAEADGRIVGYDQERLLFTGSDGALYLRSRLGGEDTWIFGDPDVRTDEHLLTTDGALFAAYGREDGEPRGLYLWRAGKLTALTGEAAGTGAGWWMMREREQAVFAVEEETELSYYHLDLRTGGVTRIPVKGWLGADVLPSGDVVLSDGQGLYTFHPAGGELKPLLMPGGGERYEQPEAGGGKLLYASGGAIVEYDGTASTVLSPAGQAGERLDAAGDYEAAGGWTAYTQSMGDTANSRQIFLRSPSGTVTQATDYETHGHPRISRLSEDGVLTFYAGPRNELYAFSGEGPAQRLATGDGVDELQEGAFYKALGRTLFKLEAGSQIAEPPLWPAEEALTVSGVTYDSALLRWKDAAARGGISAYTVYRDGEALETVGAAVYEYQAAGLEPGRAYTFSVTATDAAGRVSVNNPSVQVRTPGVPATAPPKVTLQAKPGFLKTGSELELRLRARNASDLRGFLLKLDYDRSRFKLHQIFLHPEFGTENKTVQLAKYLATPGRIGLKGTLAATRPPVNGNPGLITLRFTVLQPGEGTFTLAEGSVLTDSEGTPVSVPTPAALTLMADSADLNGDGRTDDEDITLLTRHNGTAAGQEGYVPKYDLNQDSRIDEKDIRYAREQADASRALNQ
ncbi:fibronectin type III domain-containing protein [Paenibacillus caseinilyticus]|nr:fibronectin type III domain-containing protein [Paenibacillus caseinilyticus]MCZ8523440.1 fibronectin type III domain-containing protein [Paenibacillus caseinilyticus]